MNNAVITKARAMYGKRLKQDDYLALISFKDISEAAGYLKQHPAYSKALSDINQQLIHRGHLEALIRREYYDEYARLCFNLFGGDKKFLNLFVLSYEMELLLLAVRNADTRRDDTEFGDFKSRYIDQHSELDFVKLLSIKGHSALLDELRDTKYYDILQPAMDKDQHIDYILAERLLSGNYYSKLRQNMKKNLDKPSAAIIQNLFGTVKDLNNLIRIYRLKNYYGADSTEIKLNLLRPYYKLKEDMVDKLIAGDCSLISISKALGGTVYKGLIFGDKDRYIEDYADIRILEMAKRTLHFSSCAPAVVYSYMLFKRIEIKNIKIIIESLRYQVDKDLALRRLITEKR